MFSVHSAYRLIQTLKSQRLGESSHSHNFDQLQEKLWQLKFPNNVRIFTWRACKDGLPTLSNLQKKKIAIDSSCSFCHNHGEDIAHALFYCLEVKDWWNVFLLEMEATHNDQNFIELTKQVQEKGVDSLLTNFLMMAWGPWGRRNRMLYEEQFTTPKAAFEQALAFLPIFADCSRVPMQKLYFVGSQQPPEEGSFKLNIDGAIFVDLQVTRMGPIVRDSKGN